MTFAKRDRMNSTSEMRDPASLPGSFRLDFLDTLDQVQLRSWVNSYFSKGKSL